MNTHFSVLTTLNLYMYMQVTIKAFPLRIIIVQHLGFVMITMAFIKEIRYDPLTEFNKTLYLLQTKSEVENT